ncbi:AAA family ATPase [Sulfitobacter dubius]|uniref:AAA family ATPase n=1 Tax=Sulfitobacter dubius TaxID=218673 RepID=UPI0008E0DB9C|nr:AAA family ATPase [Sulfitobacter dubius]SFH21169.1 RecA-family ATPase [Sulfitobacter dubius]
MKAPPDSTRQRLNELFCAEPNPRIKTLPLAAQAAKKNELKKPMQIKDMASPREPKSALGAALAYAAAGFPVHPVKGKVPLTKWKGAASTDEATIRGWWERWPNASVALVTGTRSGLFVVDLDIDKATGEAIGEASAARLGLAECFEGAPVARTGSGGRHVFFKAEEGFENSAGKVGEGIDTRGEGGFVVAAGSPGYEWLGPSIVELAPPPVPEKIGKAIRASKKKDGPKPMPSASSAADVVAFPMAALARQLDVMRAGEAGSCAWAEQAMLAEAGRVIAAAPGTRNHTLNRAAFSLGQIVAGGGLDRARVVDALTRAARAAGLDEHEIGPTIESGLNDGAASPRTAPERPSGHPQASLAPLPAPDVLACRKAALAARMVRATDVRPLLAAPYLVKGWLDRGAMSVVYGESNVGKSFFALSISHAVAKGERWAGCRVVGGPVFYVASEGGRSFVNRVAALDRPSERLVVIPVSIDLCGSTLDVEAVAALIRDEAKVHGEPALLVIDTLARSMGQGDENTAPDMGAFVRNVDTIREETSAHVMVIHHSGKDRARGARGHSSLRAATDTEIELTGEAGIVVAEAKKQRDMANGRRFAYQLAEVDLGEDQDGDAVTTCRVEPCHVPEKSALTPISPEQRRVLESLRQFVGDRGTPNPGGTGWPEPGARMTVDLVEFKRFAAAKEPDAEEPKKASRRVRDMLMKLEGKGLVRCNEGRIWIVPRGGNVGT